MYAYEIANALGDRGHDVDVYTQSKGDTESPFEIDDNITVITLTKARRYLVTFETLYFSLLARREIVFDEYDIIHGTLMPASPISLAIGPPCTPLIVTSHGTSIGEVRSHKPEVPTDYLKKFCFHPMNLLMDVVTMPSTSRVIAVSSIARRELERYYPVPNDKLVQIPHGVDTMRFTPDAPDHPAVDTDRFTLLHLGRLVSRKHVDLAIEGLAASGRDDVELLIAGTGPHSTRLEERAVDIGVADRVKFLGYVPEEALPSLYASSDALAFLSRYEGFGLTFLEAMAAGTAVLTTPVGGVPDIVTDGEDGIIVDHDVKSVAGAIYKLADDPNRATEMGHQARKTAENRTWHEVAADTETVYRSVLGEAE